MVGVQNEKGVLESKSWMVDTNKPKGYEKAI